MTIIGSASVQIRALTDLFEKDIKEAVAKIKDVTIKIKADLDSSEAEKQLQETRARLEAENIRLRAEADVSDVEKAVDEARARLEADKINIETKTDTTEFERAVREARDAAEAQQTAMRVNAETTEATAQLDDFHRRENGRDIRVPANAETAAASAQLAYLTRNRDVLIKPVLDPMSVSTFKNAMASLSGLNVALKLRDDFLELAENFDKVSLAMLSRASVYGAIGDSIAALGASAFTTGRDILQLSGFFAEVPALLGSMVTLLTVNHLAWDGFGKAMSSNAATASKALAALPPAAREAATAVRTLWLDIKAPVQNAYWIGLDKSLQQTFKAMAPALKSGLSEVATAMGAFSKEALLSFKKIGDNGVLKQMFDNLTAAIDHLKAGVGPLFDALNTLGLAGSKHLPQLADWMATLAQRFDNFITKADKDGSIDRWIQNAITTFKNLDSVIDGTVHIFQGLTHAFDKAGAPGLADLAKSLNGVADIVKSPVFQSQFSQIFAGAIAGASALRSGVAEVGKSFGNMSTGLAGVLRFAGETVHNFLSGISAAINTPEFQKGLVDAFAGIHTASAELKPAFEGIGKIFGDVMSIAGDLVQHLAPLINQSEVLGSKIMDILTPAIKDLIPPLTQFLQDLLTAISGPVLVVVQGIADLAKAFSGLPSGVQAALMALGAVLLIAPKLNSFWKDFKKNHEDAVGSVSNFAKNMKEQMGYVGVAYDYLKEANADVRQNFRETFSGAGFGIGQAIKDIGAGIGASFKQALGVVGEAVGGMAAKAGAGFIALSNGWEDFKRNILGDLGGLDEVNAGLARMRTAIRDGVSGAINSVKTVMTEGIGAVGTSLKEMGSYAETAARVGVSAVTDGVKAIGEQAKAAGSYVEAAARTGASALAASVRPEMDAIKGFISDNSIYMEKRFLDASAAVKGHFAEIANGARDGFALAKAYASEASVYMEKRFIDAAGVLRDFGSSAASAIQSATSKVIDVASTVANAASGITKSVAGSVADGARSLGTGIANIASSAAQALGANFAPARQTLRDVFSDLAGHVPGAVGSMGKIATAAGNTARELGTAAKMGLGGAINGITGLLGGPWGVAFTVATTALSAFGAEQQAAAQRVDDLAASLDKQTGAVTNTTKTKLAGNWMDGPTNKWDDFFRGFLGGSKSTEESLAKLNISTKTFNDRLSDPSRDRYVQSLRDTATAMAHGVEPTDAMAKALGTTKQSLKDLGWESLGHLADKAEQAAHELDAAQIKVKALAQATGTSEAQAAVLAANYETLASATSTAADKFSALKSNIDILNNGQQTSVNSTKAYYQALDNTAKAIQGIKDANGGMITNLYDVQKGFDLTKQAGRDLHTTMSDQVDAIIKVGSSALDSALKSGKSLDESKRIALAAMDDGVGTFRKSLEGLGYGKEQIDGILKSFGLIKDKYETALQVNGVDKASMDIARVSLAAQAWANRDYAAALTALPDGAKKAIGEAYGVADKFAKGDYTAVLDALNHAPGGASAALATILSVTNGDYNAILSAINLTNGPVEVARAIVRGMADAPYQAKIDAINRVLGPTDAAKLMITSVDGKTVDIVARDGVSGPAAAAKQAIDGVQGKTVDIVSRYIERHYSDTATGGSDSALGMPGIKANGGIMSYLNGFMYDKFANGGIRENHVAQIARAIPHKVRIWGEPETGGEAYIPLSPTKRGRSTAILEEVAKIFGFGLVRAFADGGFSDTGRTSVAYESPSSSGRSVGGAVPQVIINPSPGMDEKAIGIVAARELYWQLTSI